MKLIDFFGQYIKPHMLKGKRMLNPNVTGIIGQGISCIKEQDVNIWFYRKDDTIIAFDSGYKNYVDIEDQFNKINIKPHQVQTVFMTHVDIDHGGGMDKNCKLIFPQADIYLGENEEGYLTNKLCRFKFGVLKVKNTIRFQKGYKLLKDGDIVNVNNIKIQCIYTPGHTLGHTCYLIDDEILISGDCLAMNNMGGFCFFDFFNINTKLNIKSLHHLEKYISGKNIKMICTGHSGYTCNKEHAFSHIDNIAKASRKEPFDCDAPYDIFEN